jgi:hypothetical protein
MKANEWDITAKHVDGVIYDLNGNVIFRLGDQIGEFNKYDALILAESSRDEVIPDWFNLWTERTAPTYRINKKAVIHLLSDGTLVLDNDSDVLYLYSGKP